MGQCCLCKKLFGIIPPKAGRLNPRTSGTAKMCVGTATICSINPIGQRILSSIGYPLVNMYRLKPNFFLNYSRYWCRIEQPSSKATKTRFSILICGFLREKPQINLSADSQDLGAKHLAGLYWDFYKILPELLCSFQQG